MRSDDCEANSPAFGMIPLLSCLFDIIPQRRSMHDLLVYTQYTTSASSLYLKLACPGTSLISSNLVPILTIE